MIVKVAEASTAPPDVVAPEGATNVIELEYAGVVENPEPIQARAPAAITTSLRMYRFLVCKFVPQIL